MQIIEMESAVDEATMIEQRIVELVDTVRAHRERIAALEARSSAAKRELRDLLELRGENWADEEGYARLVPDGARTSYETKALDDLIIRDPLHYGWLKDYRKESVVRGSIQVR